MDRTRILELAQESKPARTSMERLQDYVQKLEDVISDLVVRSPSKADEDVQTIISGLNNIQDTYILNIKVTKDYGHTYFLKEPDVDFKKKLAKNLLAYMNSRFKGNYKNPLLSGIANEDLGYTEYLQTLFTE